MRTPSTTRPPVIRLRDTDTRPELEAAITSLRAAMASTDDPERRARYSEAIDEALAMWARASEDV